MSDALIKDPFFIVANAISSAFCGDAKTTIAFFDVAVSGLCIFLIEGFKINAFLPP